MSSIVMGLCDEKISLLIHLVPSYKHLDSEDSLQNNLIFNIIIRINQGILYINICQIYCVEAVCVLAILCNLC